MSAEGEESGRKEVRRGAVLMGTLVSILARGAPVPTLHKAIDAALRRARRLERLFNAHDPDSELNKLLGAARAGGAAASPAMRAVLRHSLRVRAWSGGAFDPAVRPALEAWGVPHRRIRAPRRRLRPAALPAPFSVPGGCVAFTGPGVRLDLGAVAKGFIIDAMVAVLRRNGAREALVNAGGDVRAFGPRPIRIGIQDPRHPGRVVGTVVLRGNACCVSANTFQREIGGGHRGHLFDPRRGAPAEGGVLAAAVVARCAADADARSTALFVGGLAGLRRWRWTTRRAALILIPARKGGNIAWHTPNFPWEPARAASDGD